jgi:hypothetical protein
MTSFAISLGGSLDHGRDGWGEQNAMVTKANVQHLSASLRRVQFEEDLLPFRKMNIF